MPDLSGFSCIGAACKPGVYALLYKGEIVYVGKSSMVVRRINEHRNAYQRHRQGKRPSGYSSAKAILFDDVWTYSCGLRELDKFERKFIDQFQPRLNINHKSSVKIKEPFELEVNGHRLEFNAAARAAAPVQRVPRRAV